MAVYHRPPLISKLWKYAIFLKLCVNETLLSNYIYPLKLLKNNNKKFIFIMRKKYLNSYNFLYSCLILQSS